MKILMPYCVLMQHNGYRCPLFIMGLSIAVVNIIMFLIFTESNWKPYQVIVLLFQQ